MGCLLASLLALGTAFAQAERPEVPHFDDPVVQGVQAHLNRLCARHDARLAAITTSAQLDAELAVTRRKLLRSLDLDLSQPRRTPGIKRAGELDFPEYRVEKLILESSPGVPVTCTVYVPKQGPARKPALLVPHGHSGRDRPVYQNGYQRLAKAGFIVLAKDGWGKQERRATGHGAEGGQLFLTGGSLLSLELWDNVRCVDYLLSRPDVDGERVGMVGLSGGGSQTLYTMAIEPRLRAGSPTCAVTTFRADLADTTMCVCELNADLLTLGDHGLFLALAYPRPMLVVNGTRDPIFPIAGARAATRQARRLYGVGGQAARLQFAEFDTVHDWSDPMLTLQIGWFRKQFGLPELPSSALGDGPIPYEKLRSFRSGELPAGALDLTRWNRKRMRECPPEEQARWVTETLRARWSGEPSLPASVTRREAGVDTSRIFRREQWSWASGLGGAVSAAVTLPEGTDAARAVVVRLDRDRLVPAFEQLYWTDQIRSAATVVDLGYTGKRLTPVQEGQVGTALLASGRSLLSERARDLLVLLRVLRQRELLQERTRLVFYGHGFDGVLLLAAAPLLPENAQLVLDETPLTYREGADLDFTTRDLLAPPAHWTLLPDLARHGDLPGLLAGAAPRRFLLLQPQDSAQQTMSRMTVRRLLADHARKREAQVEVISRETERRESLARFARLVTP
jgi:dienelactone hydrolase